MIVIRSARPSDLESVFQAARHLDSFNLTARHDFLRRLIRDSRASFAGHIGETLRRRYLFVAEDLSNGRVAGCSMILARHGTPDLPHVSLRIERVVKRSRTLGRTFRHAALRLKADRRGYTEIGGLVVLPEYRGTDENIGRKLSYARFTFIARHRNTFRPRLLVEYLAKADLERGNKLWAYLGRNFTGLSYREACLLLAENREFVLSLFPKERIYQAVLPYSALYSIGKMADGARRSLRMLKPLGFHDLRQVDPLDGGPHFGARTDEVPLVRRTVLLDHGGTFRDAAETTPKAVVLRQSPGGDVRAVFAPVRLAGARVWIWDESSRALGARRGDRLSVTPLHRVRMRS